MDQSRGERRAISVQLDRATGGQSGAVEATKLADQQRLQAIICPIPKLTVRMSQKGSQRLGADGLCRARCVPDQAAEPGNWRSITEKAVCRLTSA
jgi:hypothetical protein